MVEIIEPLILPKARALIDFHKSKQDQLLIITATLDFITRPIAESLGITNLLAPVAELLNGSYTGKIIGTHSFADGKVTRLKQWLETRSISLEGSTIAVDPDSRLKAIAKSKSWQIISLR
jgi:HAD superfamily phosphoserine phosphatase-like hydrolase